MDETLALFITYIKDNEEDKWKEIILSVLLELEFTFLHRVLQCYFEGNKAFGKFIQNWCLLLHRRYKLVSAANDLSIQLFLYVNNPKYHDSLSA